MTESMLETCDMIVPLYRLPPGPVTIAKPEASLRRAFLSERRAVRSWSMSRFPHWVDEFEASISANPANCWIALADGGIVGACSVDVVGLGVVGPLAVDRKYARHRLGRALLLAALHDLKARGHAYAILGWISVRHQAYYSRLVGAYPIPQSHPQDGMYKGMIRATVET